MKNKMPLDGLGLNHDSGSVLCNMLKSHVLGQPGGGAKWLLSLQSRDGLGQYSQIILLHARACANIYNDVK